MKRTMSQEMYDNLADAYRLYSSYRKKYLNTIDSIVRSYIKPYNSVIDFGAGDGIRINNIIAKTPVNLCLIENSKNMISRIKKTFINILVSNKDFSCSGFKVSSNNDVAVCLWNVLGHVGNRQKLLTSLKNIKKSVKKNGVIIIDVNNRHNISQYKWKAIKNIIKDSLFYSFKNGDFKFYINVNNKNIKSNVHMFTKQEIEQLIVQSDLIIKEKFYVNYTSGKLEHCSLFGQLCYVLTVPENHLS